MAIFTTFYVICNGCGHRMRPHPSPRKGIEKVLTSGWKECGRCGKQFSRIEVPNRPMVKKIAKDIKVSDKVSFLETVPGHYSATGF